MSSLPANFKSQRHCRGFSLVELMVALVITLILMAGIGQIFLGSKQSYTLQQSLGRMQENGRFAMETVAADLRRAGYYGGNADISAIIDNTPPGVSNGNKTASETGHCDSGNTDWARMLISPVFGLDDTRTNYGCLPSDTTHVGDILVVRYAAPWVVGGITTPAFNSSNDNQYFIRSSLFEGRLFKGSDEANSNNQITSSSALRTSELVANAYFIHTATGTGPEKCPGSNTVPSLYRIALRNGTLTAEEVAYGVEQFQVQYGLIDTDGDGEGDSFVDAPAWNSPQWDQVTAARIWILTRAECPEFGYTNDVTYNMGDVTNYKPNDHYRRQLFTSTVELRN